eukprot:27284_1
MSIKIQLWDTAGQERFRSISRSYYRGADGCVLVYDVTDAKSFKNVEMWLNEVIKNDEQNQQNTIIMLVGNKTDLSSKRQVTTEQGQKLADENDLMFCETSAKTGENVHNAFNNLAYEICDISFNSSQNSLLKFIMLGDGRVGKTSVNGAKDTKNFRQCIKYGIVPRMKSITSESIFYDYYFGENENKNVNEHWARNKIFDDSHHDHINDFTYYISVGLESNMREDSFVRDPLNVMIILDISGSMNACFDSDKCDQSQIEIAKNKY